MLSKAASSTIFWVFGMTRPEIEPHSPGPLATLYHKTSYHEWLGKFTCFFFSGSHRNVSLEKHQTKVLASLPWPMQILDSSLNITFIQLFTCHNRLSLAHSNLIFFHLRVSAGYHLVFLDGNLFTSCQFLILVSQKLNPVMTHLFFHLFSCTFSIFKSYCFEFSILTF